MAALAVQDRPADVEAVEGYGDVAVDRWMRTDAHRSGSRRAHAPAVCPCLTCADGRDLMNLTPFRPSWRALFGGAS